MTPRYSILDLAFVPEGSTPGDALRNSLDLAQHAERWSLCIQDGSILDWDVHQVRTNALFARSGGTQ